MSRCKRAERVFEKSHVGRGGSLATSKRPVPRVNAVKELGQATICL